MKKMAKWGFGFAPQKVETLRKRRADIRQLKHFMQERPLALSNEVTDITEIISNVKGLFNRIRRQDQWDWFTVYMYFVYMYFDYPSIGFCFHVANNLTDLRNAILRNDIRECEAIVNTMIKFVFLKYLNNYLHFEHNENADCEYVYILSRREEKELLKIGMTTRNIEKRVKEINSATGIAYPLSPRAVWKVRDGKHSEQLAHSALQEFRLREDREFFFLPFGEACKIIESVLGAEDMLL